MLRRYVLFASLICSLLLVTAMTLPQRLMASSGSTWTQPDNWQQKEMVLAVLAPDKSYPGPLTDRIPKEDTSQSNLPETAKGEYSAENLRVEGATFGDVQTSHDSEEPVPGSVPATEETTESKPQPTPIPTLEPVPELSPEPIPEMTQKPTAEIASEAVPDPTGTEVPEEILTLVNQIRLQSGLPALTNNGNLNQIALQRASELVVCTSHLRPDGRAFYTILTDNGITTASACAENFACATAGAYSANDIVQSWMASATHQANILSDTCSQIGIGYVVHENTAYYVQLFVG